jgi:hypothetical protein
MTSGSVLPKGEQDAVATAPSKRTSRLAIAAGGTAAVSLMGLLAILIDDVLAGGGPSAAFFLIFSAALFPVTLILGWVSVVRIRAGRGKLGGRGLAIAALIFGAVGSVVEIAFVVLLAVITGGFQYD